MSHQTRAVQGIVILLTLGAVGSPGRADPNDGEAPPSLVVRSLAWPGGVPEPELRLPHDGADDSPWRDWESNESAPRKASASSRGSLGSFSTQVTMRDPAVLRDQPLAGEQWHTDESWKLDLPGPVYLFGQFGAGADPAFAQQVLATGRTGLGWKLPAPPRAELQLRGGRAVSITDPMRAAPASEHAEVFVEVLGKYALPWRLGLEYQASAVPALTPLEHDKVSQDVRVAVPLGSAGKLRVGAKRQWQNLDGPRPWTEGMELYVGVELGR